MFKIAQSSDYFWPVTYSFPGDNGRTEKATFDAKFKRISQSRIDELKAQFAADEFREIDLVKDVLVGWRGVTDADGQDIPFSISDRDRLLDVPMMAAQIGKAFLESLAGAQRKN